VKKLYFARGPKEALEIRTELESRYPGFAFEAFSFSGDYFVEEKESFVDRGGETISLENLLRKNRDFDNRYNRYEGKR